MRSPQVASACFIQPPLCYVGVTEEEAVQQYKGDLDVYVSKFKPLKNTLTGREERTLMKMIVQVDTDEVSHSSCMCSFYIDTVGFIAQPPFLGCLHVICIDSTIGYECF